MTTGELAIIVWVEEKRPLDEDEVVPDKVSGGTTDVQETRIELQTRADPAVPCRSRARAVLPPATFVGHRPLVAHGVGAVGVTAANVVAVANVLCFPLLPVRVQLACLPKAVVDLGLRTIGLVGTFPRLTFEAVSLQPRPLGVGVASRRDTLLTDSCSWETDMAPFPFRTIEEDRQSLN